MGNLPCVTCGVDGREGNAAVFDLEVGLVFQHKLSYDARWDGLGEANDGIMGDDSTALEVDRGGEDDARCCKKLDGDVEHLDFCSKRMEIGMNDEVCQASDNVVEPGDWLALQRMAAAGSFI